MPSFLSTPLGEQHVFWPRRSWLVAVPCVLVILMLALAVPAGENSLNRILFDHLNRIGLHTGDVFWSHITLLGEGLLITGLIAPIIRWRADVAWSLFIAALLTVVLVNGLKEILDMPRPLALLGADAVNVIGPALRTLSFPSGHTATTTVMAMVLALHVNSLPARVILAASALLMGLSRVVVGAHWPVDALAGLFAGWVIAIVAVWGAAHMPWGRARPALSVACLVAIFAAARFWWNDTGHEAAIFAQRALSLFVSLAGIYAAVWLWRPRGVNNRAGHA